MFFRRFLNILFVAVIILWVSAQRQSQGQTMGSTGTTGTTASNSTAKLTPGSTAPIKAPKKAKQLMDQGSRALEKNELKKAETLLKSAVVEFPDYGDAWMQLGMAHQKQDHFAEARDAFKKAIAIDELNAAAYVQLGWVAIREGTLKEAEGKPKAKECKRIEAEVKVMVAEGKRNEAEIKWKEAEGVCKDMERILKEAESKWKDAVDAAEKAIKIAPLAFPETYYISALAYYSIGNSVRVEKNAETLQKLDRDHRFPQIHLILAHIKAKDQKYAAAISECRNYLKYASKAPDAEEVREKIRQYEELAKPDSPK
jgi:tetratricopeptide (TPR) repeat protein